MRIDLWSPIKTARRKQAPRREDQVEEVEGFLAAAGEHNPLGCWEALTCQKTYPARPIRDEDHRGDQLKWRRVYEADHPNAQIVFSIVIPRFLFVSYNLTLFRFRHLKTGLNLP